MARTKRSQLPPVTELDRLIRPDDIRSTPNGGSAWRCHYCGRYACDVSVQGRFLCRCHGGSTPRQRDPEQHVAHRQRTGERLRPPGRPMLSGRYSRMPKVKVADILREAQVRQQRLGQKIAQEREREMRGLERRAKQRERQPK